MIRRWTVMFSDGTFEFVDAENEQEAQEKAKELRKQKDIDRLRYPSERGQ
jgi:hypothetical protein